MAPKHAAAPPPPARGGGGGGGEVKSMLCFAAVSSVYAVLTNYVFRRLYDVNPTPYMDEIFHVPQAQNYCQGKYDEWDPKITTFPGLYIASVFALWASRFVTTNVVCSLYSLRLINLAGSYVNFLLLYLIMNKQHPPTGGRRAISIKNAVTALNLSLFPVLHFFTFLYYTDTLSTAAVLLMYYTALPPPVREKVQKDGPEKILLSLKKDKAPAEKPAPKKVSSGSWVTLVAGAAAIFMRQTNVVWVLFVACVIAKDHLKTLLPVPKSNINRAQPLSLPEQITDLVDNVRLYLTPDKKAGFARKLWTLVKTVVRPIWSYLALIAAFCAFVAYNGAIVVGDKSAHEACLHTPQLIYFAAFAGCFAAPYFVAHVGAFVGDARRHWARTSAVALAFAGALHFNWKAHIYLLADNRHYTFYLWRRVLAPWRFRYPLLVPLGIFSAYCLDRELRRRDVLFKLSLLLCTALTLVPQRLLELRYFVVPFLLFRLQAKPDDKRWWQIALDSVLVVGVNVATWYLFEYKPFLWGQETQRFIW